MLARALAILALPLVLAAQEGSAATDPIAEFVRQTLGASIYERVDADLNGDGRPEIFVYVNDPARCGSGGCNLFILSPAERGFRIVLRSTVTQLPISLLPTSTNAWRDVGVTVAGGGARGPYMARLRFDGTRYPGNPTLPPAMPLGRTAGEVLLR